MNNILEIKKLSLWEKNRKTVITIFGLGILFGLVYPILNDGFSSPYPFINGLTIGVIGSGVIAITELVIFAPPKVRLNFYSLVIIKVLIYAIIFTLLIFCVLLISRSVEYGLTIGDTWRSAAFQHLVFEEDFFEIIGYALILVFFVIFFKEISYKLGPSVLMNFILGRYYHPKREHRIFLFIDLCQSAHLAEILGDIRYHHLLNDFFDDVTESAIYTKGEIYQFVGDEVVITWPTDRGLKKANCLKIFFYAKQQILSRSEMYLKKFGLIPEFKAALHCGNIIRGEVGHMKTEIAFHGDVINTTARIERLCSKLKEEILISDPLFNKFSPEIQKKFVFKGEFHLKGKEKDMPLYGIV